MLKQLALDADSGPDRTTVGFSDAALCAERPRSSMMNAVHASAATCHSSGVRCLDNWAFWLFQTSVILMYLIFQVQY